MKRNKKILDCEIFLFILIIRSDRIYTIHDNRQFITSRIQTESNTLLIHRELKNFAKFCKVGKLKIRIMFCLRKIDIIINKYHSYLDS
jgi:hypothetical protein